MSRELPKSYEPGLIEERWAEFWVRERIFEESSPADTQVARGKFTMLLPPPNVTGRLHMGHMLNQTEMDVLTRWHRMRGDVATWIPGTDHAGIATQMMVERQIGAEGTTRQELGREAFVKRVWTWKCIYGNAILDQMKRLGASVDWRREYFTMDDRLSAAVKEAFVRLYDEGLIYRGAYIVNWDPVAGTAVSDLEVEHEERAGKLYLVRYPLVDGTGEIVIATTRPETMLGDVAIAVNPTDERYKSSIGRTVRLPLSSRNGGAEREIPIIADEWANPEFGTGAVKITPAHDANDFAVGERHDLPKIVILDEQARVDLPGSPYHGLDRFEARERIVADLAERGLLVEIKEHLHAVATSQRTGAVIEPRLSMQWFVRIQPLADKAIAAVREGHIRFTPEMYAKTYFEWMENIHDWCISRQLWWGHRIPAWHCAACGGITVARDAPGACVQCSAADGALTQETDVLDTWFSSGLLPFTVFGWPEQTADLNNMYPTQLLLTGFDILFFWVARMIMLGCHFMLGTPNAYGIPRTLAESVPFTDVYIHALVRDADRQKMSKTKGNVIDPIDMIVRFGTDAVRFTLASMASPGTDIAFSEARTEGNRAFANKIWNAARFVFLQLDRADQAGYKLQLRPADGSTAALPEGTPVETRWIFSRLSAVTAEVDRALGAYRFDEAANAVYQFFWGEFCDWYLELIKLRLDLSEGTERNDVTAISLGALASVFEAALRLLSPFMPFLTEELWHALYGSNAPAKSIALMRFPQAPDFPVDTVSEETMTLLQELIVTVRALRKELGVPEKELAPIRLHASNRIAALVDAHQDVLARMARVSSVELAGEALAGGGVRATVRFEVAVVYERQIDVPAERERLGKEIARLEKGRSAAERQLGSASFVAKAPPHIVEGLRKQAAETELLYARAKAEIDALPPG